MILCLSVSAGDQKCIQHPSEPTILPSRKRNVHRTVWPTDHLFTSSPVSSQFKTSIFQIEQGANSVNNKQLQQGLIPALSVTPKNQINGAPDLNDSSLEPQLEQLFVIPSSTLKLNTSGMDLDTEEGEQSIFYSPELFEGDGEEKEESTEVERSPAEVSHPASSTASILLEDLFGLEQGKRTLSKDIVNSTVPDNTLLKGCVEQKESYCSADFENVSASQNDANSSRSRRLSRSRQKRPSTSAASGKLTNYFKIVPPTSQPCIITVDD